MTRPLAVLLLCLLLPSAAHAQSGYFGQNKVQYKEFKFQVLKTEHFDIYFYPEEEKAARMAAQMAERWYTRISRILTHELRGRQPLILYASGTHFRQTTAIEGELGEGTGGVTEAAKRRIVLPFAGPIEQTDHVLGHELVHAFQYDTTNVNVTSGQSMGALNLPLWFIEGMAEYLSIGPVDPHTAMWMRESARREKLPAIKDLDNPKYFPYRYGQAFWAFIGGTYGDQRIGTLLRAAAAAKGNYDEAFKAVLGVDSKTLSEKWQQAEFDAYKPVALVTKMPDSFARPLILTNEKGASLNVSPEVSPDGTKMMFFSERDLFSINLYLADAKTGKVIRKVVDTAAQGHLETLQFIESAGAWDPTSTKFVFPAVVAGTAVLDIVNANNGNREREIKLKDVDEVLNPAWSPDGNRIAFSGQVNGFNDLFVYDLTANSMTRLTNDAFAELDPAWSPDGKSLAFSTDRFTTNLDRLAAGHLRIAVMDVATQQVKDTAGFPNAKNIDPQWTKDGRSIYFLSDRGGITNIYHVGIDGGEPTQLTNLLTGVSGITALSPAMSVADGRIIFSSYENDGYSVYAIDEDTRLAGTTLTQLPIDAAILPPRTKAEGPVATAIMDTQTGLGKPATQEPEDYSPKLTMDYAGQPTIGVGVDPFGAYAAGGVSFVFSDLLGVHTVAASAQVSSRFDEFGGTLLYLNKQHRWNWGGSVDSIPYVYSSFATGFTNSGGSTVYVEQEDRILQQDRSVNGILAYPFNRSLRVEFNGGYRSIGLKEDITQWTYDANTGQAIDKQTQTIAELPTLHLMQTSTALVYDTSIFGVTSPIRGARSRVEWSQSAGSLL
jgi:Tol biopolymer transport system component